MPIESLKQIEISQKPIEDVLSATRVAEALSKMDINETPSRVLDLLAKKIPAKPPRAVSSNSTSKNSRSKLCDTNTPASSTIKSSRLSSEDFTTSPINKYDISKENESHQMSNVINHNHLNNVGKNSQKILRDTTNIPLTGADLKEPKLIEVIDLSSDNEWIDARPNIPYTPDKNGTICSITESPSYSCSELEFSEDEKPEYNNEKRETDIGIGKIMLLS